MLNKKQPHKKQSKNIFFTAIFVASIAFVALIWSPNANATIVCNTNTECYEGWMCIGGEAENGTQLYAGSCIPTSTLRETCWLLSLVQATVGRLIVLVGVVSISISMWHGKVNWVAFFTLMLGAFMIFAPFQVLAIFTRNNRVACNFGDVDYFVESPYSMSAVDAQ